MSELNGLVNNILSAGEECGIFHNQYAHGRVSLAKEVADLLDVHDAEIREQAKREQLEADCDAAREIGPGWQRKAPHAH